MRRRVLADCRFFRRYFCMYVRKYALRSSSVLFFQSASQYLVPADFQIRRCFCFQRVLANDEQRSQYLRFRTLMG